MYEIGRMKR